MRTPDHPRIRGEHPMTARRLTSTPGSSPHTRGARLCRHRWGRRRGIIPAYAGSTRHAGRSASQAEDHPRIRGEHGPRWRRSRRRRPSSPHTRGARVRPRCRETLHGIIPAYAGSTRPGSSWNTMIRDHPRIRGEHAAGWTRAEIHRGIIPAYAGSTPQARLCRPRARDHPRIRGEHRWQA